MRLTLFPLVKKSIIGLYLYEDGTNNQKIFKKDAAESVFKTTY